MFEIIVVFNGLMHRLDPNAGRERTGFLLAGGLGIVQVLYLGVCVQLFNPLG